MKNLVLLIFCFLSITLEAQDGEWIKIPAPVNADLECMYVHDSLNVWIAGDSGFIGYSSDWGKTWEVQQTNDTSYIIKDIHFLDSLNGWAIGFREEPPFTKIFNTIDGGSVWFGNIFPEELIALNTVYFTDTLTGYIAGNSGAIYKTTDAGFKWTECRVDSFRLDINDIQFIDDSNGLGCGGIRDLSGVIWRSSDAGETWIAVPIPYEPVWELHIFDSLNIIGVGGDLEYGTAIIRSYDGGYSWDYNSLSIFGVGTSISFRNDAEAWCTLGSDLKLIYSADTGKTWISFPSPDNSSLYDLEFADSLHGMAVGSAGAVYVYRKKAVSVNPDNPAAPDDFFVYQNYPNPFNSSTKLKFVLPSASFVSIEIIDITGRKIFAVGEERDKGINTFTLDMKNYPSGIYFYSIKWRGLLRSGKMVYLR